jgi:Xaa-Pro aminopeptidase
MRPSDDPTNRPTIPPEEYPVRWRRVQELMAQQGLDLLIAYADDRAVFGPAHLRWLAGIPVHFEPMCLLMPREGDPIVLCGPESDQYALRIGQVADVRVLREFTHPDEDYPFSKIESFAEVAASVTGGGGRVRRVGVAGRGLMSADTANAFSAALPGVQWIDVEHAACNLRAIKTPAEIAVIRYAYRLAELELNAAVDAIRPGVMEWEIAAEAEAAMRRAGAEGTGIDTIVASGPNSRPILARATSQQVASNDLVLLTVAPRYQGYHAAIGRPVLVGQPPAEAEHALDAGCRAQEACYRMMRAGVEGRTVEKAGRDVMAEAGLAQYFLYSGLHSVGVIEFEPPIFGPSSPATLEENMVISIDIPVFNAPWGGLRVEDGFLITGAGAERLNQTPFIIRK